MTTYIIIVLINLQGLIVILPQIVFAYKQDSVCFINNQPEKYDKQYQICCKNKIQTRLRDQYCCDNEEFYFGNKSLCCGSKVLDRFVVDCKNNKEKCSPYCSPNDAHCTERICCGAEAIIKSETKCCYGSKIHLTQQHKTNLDFLLCCNETHLYDVRSEICCNKRVFPLNRDNTNCCGDRIYSQKLNTCLLTTDSSGALQHIVGDLFENVCGTRGVYNRKFNGCCDGVVYPEPEMVAFENIWRPNPNFKCCDQLFMRLNEKCCRQHHSYYFETHIIPNLPELSCCGTGFYNRSRELCNNGTKVPIQFDKKRCGWGFQFYDPAKEECCGFEVYPKDKFQCCEGKVIGKNMQCCNGVGIDFTHICCDGLPAKKSYDRSDKCCVSLDYSSAKAYSRKDGERCVEGSVLGGYPKNTEPCGQIGYFDPRNQTCCNGETYDASWGCCEEQAYNKSNQTCCFNTVLNLPADESRCCEINGKAYRFNDTNNPCLKPCGSAYYDDSTEVCCQEKVHIYNRNFKCCGRSYINTKRKECCGDRRSFGKQGNMRCCGNRDVYNSKSHFCNSEGLIHSFYTSKLCKPRVLKGFKKTSKALACNSTYGVSGVIENVSVENTNLTDQKTLSINLKVNKWLGRRTNMPAGSQTVAFSIHVHWGASTNCTQHLPKQAKVMVFFENEPVENKVTILKESKVFLFGHSAWQEQEMLSCRSKI